MKDSNNGSKQEYTVTEDRDDHKIGRRTYLKLAGTALGSVSAAVVESDTVRAASDGYGSGGYGEGAYGGGNNLIVSTQDVMNVGSTSATLNGSLDDLGGADSVHCYFKWQQMGMDSWETTAKQTITSTGSFSEDLSSLTDGSDYEYRAVTEASDGDVSEGSIVTFTTTEEPPAVRTDAPSIVTDSNATLAGSLTDLGNAASADCYFKYRKIGATSWDSTATQTLSSTGSFTESITGLSTSTDYEYRAVAVASDGDSVAGEIGSFTTSGSSTAPVIDSYWVTEARSPNPHCEITADWDVSDTDGDLESVSLVVLDSSDSIVDSATASVGGSNASGTENFKIKHVKNQMFDVTVTVTDTKNNSNSQTQTISE